MFRLIKKTNLKLPIEVRSVINRLFDAPGIKSNCKACIEFPVPVYSIPPQPSWFGKKNLSKSHKIEEDSGLVSVVNIAPGVDVESVVEVVVGEVETEAVVDSIEIKRVDVIDIVTEVEVVEVVVSDEAKKVDVGTVPIEEVASGYISILSK